MTTEIAEHVRNEEAASRSADLSAAAHQAIYLYYIQRPVRTEERDTGCEEGVRHHHGELRVFFYNNKRNEPIDAQLVQRLIDKVSEGDLITLGYAVDDLVLRQKGSMLFVWQEEGRELKEVEFIFNGELSGNMACRYTPTSGTHPSFDDFRSVKISSELSFVHGTNKRLRADGRPLGPCSEKLNVEFKTDPLLPRIHTESATNTGP